VLPDPLPGPGTDSSAGGFVGTQQGQHCSGQCLRVPSRDDCARVAQQEGGIPDVGGDAGHPRRHRLAHGVGEALAAGGGHGHIETGQESGNVVAAPEQMHPMTETQVADPPRQARVGGDDALAAQHGVEPVAMLDDVGQRFQEVSMSLGGIEPGHHADEGGARIQAELTAQRFGGEGSRPEGADVDAVGNDDGAAPVAEALVGPASLL
jgi:hypothetical protein